MINMSPIYTINTLTFTSVKKLHSSKPCHLFSTIRHHPSFLMSSVFTHCPWRWCQEIRREGQKKENVWYCSTHVQASLFTSHSLGVLNHFVFPWKASSPLQSSHRNVENKSQHLKHRNLFSAHFLFALTTESGHQLQTSSFYSLSFFFPPLSDLWNGWRMMKTHFHYVVASPQFNLISGAH